MTSASVLGVDTNVLVRFLANDDDVQTPMAARLLTAPANQPIHISLVVLAETYTVLTKVKKFPVARVNEAIRMLLSSNDFVVEKPRAVMQALDDCERAECGLVDAMIAVLNVASGCEVTATFDTRAQRLPNMIAVKDRL
jgi:predicted nucleic-acid-binding protein